MTPPLKPFIYFQVRQASWPVIRNAAETIDSCSISESRNTRRCNPVHLRTPVLSRRLLSAFICGQPLKARTLKHRSNPKKTRSRRNKMLIFTLFAITCREPWFELEPRPVTMQAEDSLDFFDGNLAGQHVSHYGGTGIPEPVNGLRHH